MDFGWAGMVALIKDVWWFLSVPLAALMAFGMWYLRGQFPTKAEYADQTKALNKSVTELSAKIDANDKKTGDRLVKSEREMSDRIAKLEGDVKQLPGRPEMENLSDRISRVETQIAASAEMTRGVEKTVNKMDHTLSLILGHLLDANKKEKSS
ncbi:hypothetical protein HNR60_001525 [Rhodopseudomonas rhenobacensis]|uniref:DUF2730 family protein n=1 Tax=Rhodopseudomonas rhenobacensis TaxID=87461 RepID=A0A7W7Z2H4_9BRAD|nr:hypothetical protein [Rhodopseudomonas rhenobacensis]MBB5046777.1 hypothetical protein [Rhodopseudomonas rhenobacensis]